MGKQLAFVHQDLERYHGFVRMKVIGWKTTVKTSATSDIGRLTKSLKKKMKMNHLTFRRFSVSKGGNVF